MGFEPDLLNGRPCDLSGCAASTDPSVSFRPLRPLHTIPRGGYMRSIALDVHRDFCEVAIKDGAEVRSAGRIKTTPEELGLFQNTAPMVSPEHGTVFVLIHSPLVGPTTWSPLTDELGRRGCQAVAPSLLGVADAPSPQWRHAPEAVRAATARAGSPAVLVGHSGGGLLLPVIADALPGEVDALVFVDSLLPPAGGSLPLAGPGLMDQLRALASGGVLPPWSSWFDEGAIRELVPDESLRAALEAEMPRLPLSYFEASVPLPDGWDARRCAYLLFTAETYGASAAEARDRGWQVAEVQGVRHLAMATHPVAVADALLDLQRMLSDRPRR
jgi:pimeloyl-ACP methyl ester carboxylesterase